MRLLVDGIFFQLASSGIARLWSSILPKIVMINDMELYVLDRGGLPEIPGAKIIPFPTYKERYSADDSFLIQKVCDFFDIEIFTSTYYTSCISTPMLLIIYDMIPELFDFDLTSRFWQEKEIAISFARRFIAISEQTKRDLIKFYPEVPQGDITVAHLGVDTTVFNRPKSATVKSFCKSIEYERPYFLLVGSREQNKGYKNTEVFFKALEELQYKDVDVLCLGGEEEIAPSSLARIPNGCLIKRILVSNEEMRLAYAGALALIYPSLYEGFGLPVLEAMASGCPVITTTNGALSEIVGSACMLVDPYSVSEMVLALKNIRVPKTRESLISEGLLHVRKFTWDQMVQTIEIECKKLIEAFKAGAFREFLQNWELLRKHQASVDTEKL